MSLHSKVYEILSRSNPVLAFIIQTVLPTSLDFTQAQPSHHCQTQIPTNNYKSHVRLMSISMNELPLNQLKMSVRLKQPAPHLTSPAQISNISDSERSV